MMSDDPTKSVYAIECPVTGCTWQYKSSLTQEQSILEIIQIHIKLEHSPQPTTTLSAAKPAKLEPPSVDIGVNEEEWNTFKIRWKQYCNGVNLRREEQSLPLFNCASKDLGDQMINANRDITEEPVEKVMSIMKAFAVVRVAKSVVRGELMKMTQGNDEPIRTFASRVQAKAETCGFVTTSKCRCGCDVEQEVYYTEQVIKDVVIAGIADMEIQTSVLDTEDIEDKTVREVISLVERKQRSRKACRQSSISAVSAFKKQQFMPVAKPDGPPSQSPIIPCPGCNEGYRKFTGKNYKPYKQCRDCFVSRRSRGTKSRSTVNASATQDACDTISQQPSINTMTTVESVQSTIDENNQAETGALLKAKLRSHPQVTLRIGPVNSQQSAEVSAIADTGAQSNLWGLQDFLDSGFQVADLQKATLNICAANKQQLNVVGGFDARLEGESPSGKIVSCETRVYISDSVVGFYLSFDTLVALSVLDDDFPIIGCYNQATNEKSTSITHNSNGSNPNIPLSHVRSLNSGCLEHQGTDLNCKCPQRSAVPLPPESLPFEPSPQNNEKMKQWLLQRYGSSTFNTCPHRPLQEMAGPPIAIHLDADAKPRVCNTPAPIPLHWQKRVEEDLKRDEALGIVEKVPYGVPVTWCHRMVVARKHDGSPRRTVDLSPLNKFCKREVYSSESPFLLARRIPPGTWKTVTDAWNGFHSVPLREADRHLTTFITPFGRWRYTRAPQGYLSSGDGYNKRFEAILADFERKERCVDDTVYYDNNLEQHWWRTIKFLTKVGQAGIVLNPDKFQFACKSVSFAGFKVSEDTVEPLPKYLEAIRSFPTPATTTDIKSWFGLVNQLSSYAQLRHIMEPFRPFLSPKVRFSWDPDLDKAFQQSKQAIVDSIKHGVRIFDLERHTCLRPDWSVKGIGYFLLQKHCQCAHIMPDCCTDGWKVTLAGSRFLTSTESRYAAIEGEALAIVWGLEQTRYFTQGCNNLLVVTDHKPLTKIFGDRTLDEVTNTRLFRLKQRTLPWRFDIAYLPGKTNKAADATSRHPTSTTASVSSIHDLAEELTMASIHQEASDLISIPWQSIVDETAKDPVLSELGIAISTGFEGEYPNISQYMRYKDSLYNQDGAIMYSDRVVVPTTLRSPILNSLHAAHQGVSSMTLRAQAIVFWPGMTNDIQEIRARCQECHKNAPSQADLPSTPATPPSTPFEEVFADYFDFGGRHYLVAGDRLSGWVEVFSAPYGSKQSGARGLVKCLRQWFSTFGVPRELTSDGGPEFTADLTSQFLKTWGVEHRVSSAYYPRVNGRAEVAVKKAKRLMRTNVGPCGTINNDRFLRAILQLRNTPEADCNVSPAEIVFGRPMRDNLSFTSRIIKKSFSKRWQQAWSAKEEALRARFIKTSEKINLHSKQLPPLKPGMSCFIQNQHGPLKNKWHNTGIIMEALPFDQYTVKMDGSGRLTTRNRKFLRAYTPASVTTLPPLMVTDETPRLATPAQEAIRDDRATDISIDECPQFEEVGKLQDPATSPTTGLGTRRMPCASSRNPAASPSTGLGTRQMPCAPSRNPAASPTTGLGTRRMPCAPLRNPAASPTTGLGTRRMPCAPSQDPAASPTTDPSTRRMPCASSRNPAASPTTAPGTRRVPRALSRLHDFNAPGRKEGARNLRRR